MLSDSGNKSTQAANGRRKTIQKQKVPEASVLRACCDLLTAERIWWCRMNSGAVKDGKRFFRFGRKGMADILATPRFQGAPFPLWIECKSSIGRQSADQQDFESEIIAWGHSYLLARSSDDLKNWLIEHGVIKP